MPTCLTKEEIRECAELIEAEFERLMTARTIAAKPGAKRWAFFRHCLDVLLRDECPAPEYDVENCGDYWDYIKEKLENYYSGYYTRSNRPNPGDKPALKFKFWLKSQHSRKRLFGKESDYACTSGYMMLVIPTGPGTRFVQQTRNAFARVVDDAIDATFDALNRVPKRRLRRLALHYAADGPAYADIARRIDEHIRHQEVICNPLNPSTRPQLRDVRVLEVGDERAVVSAEEYWNLHWLSTGRQVYVKSYEGKKTRTYTLVRRGGRWVVFDNAYRTHRDSIP